MKKKFWMLGVALAALTSCTQSEVVDLPEAIPVDFKTYVGKNSRTEAQTTAIQNVEDSKDVTTTSLTNFFVFADRYVLNSDDKTINTSVVVDNVLKNVWVTYDSSERKWKYSPLAHWVTGSLYRFAAYSNGNDVTKLDGVAYHSESNIDKPEDSGTTVEDPDTNAGTGEGTEEGIGEGTNNPNHEEMPDHLVITGYECDGEKDLIGAITNDRNTAGAFVSKVEFPFVHLLSKIIVRIYSNNEFKDSKLWISDVKLTNLYTKGDCEYDFSNSVAPQQLVTWSNRTDNNEYSVKAFVETGNPVSEFFVSPDIKSFVFYVIPQYFEEVTDIATSQNPLAPTLTFTAKSYSNDDIEDGQPKTNAISIHEYNESFNLNPLLHNGGSQYPRWAPGQRYIYEVYYDQSKTEEKVIDFGVGSVAGWGTVTSVMALTPANDPRAGQNSSGNTGN